ncbi:MAG TPA: ATP-dependent helicase [Dissulfurispiraceae bacterium]|nr:ATP-dependent helicase [Dissulfurispiraceae bacterium]
MKQVFLVTGYAGTGKTTWLMQKANELAPSILTAEHHALLAMTRMHGARRRVQTKLRESCPTIRCSVSTIDAFALSILNRWRTALGYSRPIQAVSDDANFANTLFGTEASFGRVLAAATSLLQSTTVRNVLSRSYPLILIDEFQDCHGQLLEFVKALSECSSLILAADDFQVLDSSAGSCPGLAWVQTEQKPESTECISLSTCYRTSVQPILDAARCLRDNTRSSAETIPVIACPDYGPAAFKILEALVFNAKQWQGSTALICPSHDPFVQEVLSSLSDQLQKRNLHPIKWFHESSAEHEQQQIRDTLGLATTNGPSNGNWVAPSSDLDPIGSHIVSRSQRFAKLKGIKFIPHVVVARHIDAVVHEKRAYSVHTPKRIVTTIHGAKNREFDNVIVLWPYTVISDQELQRRLLYNAITRSKRNCVLLVRGDLTRAQNDPVLSLLGPARPAFPPKSKKPIRRKKKAAP